MIKLNKSTKFEGVKGPLLTIVMDGVGIAPDNGANAIAHTCLDRRTPGKKDDVSFAVTHIDEERGVAGGIITRIIKQHL